MTNGISRLEAWIIGITALAMAGFMASMLITAGWWFRMDSLTIYDGRVGQEIRVDYSREFFRDFDGVWRLAVWRMDRGFWTAYCGTGGEWPYKRALPPTDRTFEWLVSGNEMCANLPPGEYMAELTITANPNTIISRSQTITSNVFKVTP